VFNALLFIRAGILCPALALIFVATFVPFLKTHYQIFVGSCAAIAGIAVMWITATAATAQLPQFAKMGDVLVLVYGCLFLGLLFRAVIAVAVILIAAYFHAGVALGIQIDELIFGGALLTATGAMAILSALRNERLVRAMFMETQIANDAAQRDALTRLFNRGSFDVLAEKLWRQAQREFQPIQFLLIDIDHFKKFNDRYGHQAGDECLRRVADVIERSASRPLDFCARYGGEEFAVVIYGPTPQNVADLPEQIRAAVIVEGIPHRESDSGVLTVSIGSAFVGPGSDRSLPGLIQAADEALYEAKDRGRNKVVHRDAGQSASTGSFNRITPDLKAG
jgi:diguanylate cyclase (GGDEF)-like protein